MISMTGYAYKEKAGEISASVEIKGCNNRYLEVCVNMPPWLTQAEEKIKEKISSCCGRGKIDVFIRIREINVPVNITINKNAAKSYYEAIINLANELKIKEKPTLSMLLGIENMQTGRSYAGSIFDIEKERNEQLYWEEIGPLFDEALKIFCNEREREGLFTEKDIVTNLEKLVASLNIISGYIPEIENTLKQNVKTRFEEMLGNKIDESKILAETASLLIKYTISEEISRLASHINEFVAETEKNPKPGKKLDFLCQEINREINTIGSKSAIIEVTKEVVTMKEALENIREQLRNIE